jgi:hypothetical protein
MANPSKKISYLLSLRRQASRMNAGLSGEWAKV